MPANKRDFSPMINDKPKTNLNAYKGKTIILLISQIILKCLFMIEKVTLKHPATQVNQSIEEDK